MRRSEQVIDYYRSLFDEPGPGWDESRRALHEIIDICARRGIPCYVVLFPILFDLNERYAFRDIHTRIRDEVEGTSAVFVDLLEKLEGRDATRLWVHPTDQHPNEIVHRIAAEALVEAMGRTTWRSGSGRSSPSPSAYMPG
jgi:hypothetical protein